ncbi:MAG: histidinol-phosphate transaminase [Candidatus Lokiarchaeota archaeon]|nr:histidinol-phosphate transaminase [Candidatus Lokiarchaeota archaeon]
MELNKLIRAHLRKFDEYVPGEQPSENDWIKLNANENPYPPISEIVEDIKKNTNEKLRLYPDPLAKELKTKIINKLLKKDNPPQNINSYFVGNGTDEVLEVIYKVFIEVGDDIVYLDPSYGMYKTLSDLFGANSIELKLNEDFSLPESIFKTKGKLLIICSPNNPTGKSFDNELILKICKNFFGIVIVDETYCDFTDKTAIPLLNKINNLIITRTFSKSFSLASLRVGYAISNPKIINIMNQVKLPYNVNYLSQIAAISCIDNMDKVFERNKKIISERERISKIIDEYENINVLPSDANFILVEFKDKSQAIKLFEEMKKFKILIRYFSKPSLEKYLRISIGTENENKKLLDSFKDIVKNFL